VKRRTLTARPEIGRLRTESDRLRSINAGLRAALREVRMSETLDEAQRAATAALLDADASDVGIAL